jgi:hypothetical protein
MGKCQCKKKLYRSGSTSTGPRVIKPTAYKYVKMWKTKVGGGAIAVRKRCYCIAVSPLRILGAWLKWLFVNGLIR